MEGRLYLPKGRKVVFTFGEAGEKYFEKQLLEGAKNLKQKKHKLHLHIIPFFGRYDRKLCMRY